MSIVFFGVLFILSSGCAQTEKTEAITADITAAQMEGRNAARRIIGREWKDTSQLQKELLEIKALQSKYIIAGNQSCAEAFDTAFISTIRTVNPKLAYTINKKP